MFYVMTLKINPLENPKPMRAFNLAEWSNYPSGHLNRRRYSSYAISPLR